MKSLAKKPRKTSRKGAVNKADKYASLDIRLDGKCVICGATDGLVETVSYSYTDEWTDEKHTVSKVVSHGPLVCGHLFSRIAYSTRWDERDLYCLCSHCNIAMENDPDVAAALLEYAKGLWGDDAIDELHRQYAAAVPVKTHTILEYAEHWKSKYHKHCAWRGIEATA